MDFDELCDFETTKIRQLFFLLQTTYPPHSIEQLAEEIDLNRKTLLKYIEKLQKLFNKYKFTEQLKIVKVGRNELYLHRESNIYALTFNIYYLLDTIEIQLLILSLESELVTFREIAVIIGISESLLRNRICKLNTWLKKYSLKLERQSYKLVGEESQVREFLFQFNQFFPNGVGRKEGKLHQEAFLLANHVYVFFGIIANDIQKNLIFELINVVVDRVKKGYSIEVQKNWEEYVSNSPWFEDFLTKVPYKIIPRSELTYLFLIIQVKFSFLFSEVKQAQMIQDHFLRKTKCFQNTSFVTKRINYFFSEEKINYDKPVLLACLSFHLYYELVDTFNFETIDNLNQLYQSYPKFMNKLEKAVINIQQQNTYFSNIEKNILIYRYFQIFTSVICPLKNENKKYICLLTELPPEKEMELKQQLKHFFYNKVNLQVIFGRESKSFLYADVILVSNVSQKIMEETSQPVLLVEDAHLKLEELLEIEKILKIRK